MLKGEELRAYSSLKHRVFHSLMCPEHTRADTDNVLCDKSKTRFSAMIIVLYTIEVRT